MNRRSFLKLIPVPFALQACGVLRIDPWNPLLRSDVIRSPEDADRVISKAKLTWTDDERIRVLYVNGTPYERGYQQGFLLRKEIQDNMGYLFETAVKKFRFAELFDEAYERMRPFIPQEYIDEMHGLAHGSKLPLHIVHGIHVLADIGEWGGKKRIGGVVKQMMNGELGTMCSNIGASGSATADGGLLTVRVLDWGLHRISKLHQYPLITVNVSDGEIPNANIGWVGYLGTVSGMNAEGITLGEMGYRSPPNETLYGIPMPFMLRQVLSHSSSLADVRKIIKEAIGTNSYVFLMTDGKTKESEMYVKDRDRFLVFEPGTAVHDTKEDLPAIANISYGGRYNAKMTEVLTANHGKLTPDLLMNDIIPQIVMPSNFQNVVYEPTSLSFWVANAKDKRSRAAESPYTKYDLGAGLRDYKAGKENLLSADSGIKKPMP